MTRGELRAAMKAQRAAMKEQLREVKARTEVSLANNPHVQKARRSRRLKRIAAIALLLLLLLLIRCEGPGGPAEPLAAVDAGTPAEKVVVKKAGKPMPKKVSIAPKPVGRPDFDTPARLQAAWVDEFRLQVAARSPRLSACFIGSNRPGALRWTTLVSLQTGAVGNHEFESMGVAADLTKAQLDCLQAVLTKPEYRLGDAAIEGLPERVSLVLEF